MGAVSGTLLLDEMAPAARPSLKLSEVLDEKFSGPQSQDFAAWLRKFELGTSCSNVHDAQKVNVFLAYLESPCFELAFAFVILPSAMISLT